MLRPGKNIRLFRSDFLERLSYVHPAVPVAFWSPIVGLELGWGITMGVVSLGGTAFLAALGFGFWTLAEYALHRFIFHFQPRGPFEERVAFLIHGVHHADPGDERRLLMPLAAAIAIAIPFHFLFWVFLGAVAAKPFFSGFILGYLCYDYTHFAVHYLKPKGVFLKALRKNHMLHHFAMPDRRFGVSCTLWDHVFATREKRDNLMMC